jgi:hypothetical protein
MPNPPPIPSYLTPEFKNLVQQQAEIIKQDVSKDGWMRAWVTSKTAHDKSIPHYEAATIGDLGPTPDFIIRGLSDREHNRGFGDAKDYYTHLNFTDIQRQIINQPLLLKRIYDDQQKVYEQLVNMERQTGREPTDAQKTDFKNRGVRMALMGTYYASKNSLMGDIQRDAIVNQSLMVSVANSAAQATLKKFKPDYLKDMFPDGIMPWTSKRTLELRSRGFSPEEIKKQIQVEENFFRARDIQVNDSNLERFNTFINACFTQALATNGGMPELDIDNLMALDATYALDAEETNIKERAQRIMRHVKDPKTAYMWWFLEQEELERRRNWWRGYV